ncbi:MAG: Uma2 family endonuclease [Chloroflexota bacterium]|nr:Uma2 family endonuclease [Chloroflexota bacterium]
MTPADWVPGPGQGNWTYDLYAALPDDGKRYEVVDGVLYMSPSPGDFHQKICLLVAHYLLTHVMLAGLGQVRPAPFDVELAPDTIVQPDVMVVLNAWLDRITPSRIKGAPDLVIEVLSPATEKYDRTEKRAAYERAGVTEYWLVDPIARTVEVLFLEEGTYRSAALLSGQDRLISRVVPTIENIRVERCFGQSFDAQ